VELDVHVGGRRATSPRAPGRERPLTAPVCDIEIAVIMIQGS
jgi:hypothetical protein